MNNDANVNAVLLTVEQAADYLGLAVSTLNRWRCHGEGPVFIKLGRAVRYRKSDINAYIERRSLSCTISA